jgi:hypothetical protein
VGSTLSQRQIDFKVFADGHEHLAVRPPLKKYSAVVNSVLEI